MGTAKLLEKLRCGEKLTLRDQILLTVQLSIPAILAQISSIVMQYIDASMVGHLGADGSAAIGVVAVLLFSCMLMLTGVLISGGLPAWLGADASIYKSASGYFLVYACFLPVLQLNSAAGGMLQCSGNMRLPSMLHIMMCFLDVAFNAILIFPAREVVIPGREGITVRIFGAGLGVAGAALGTALAELVTACLMLYFLLVRSPMLHLRRKERLRFQLDDLAEAVKIALPVGFEQVVMCGAQIMSTRIVAPLGTIAIAANSLSVTAESLCYMPGYGIGTAATTLIGQSIGAGRKDLTRRLGWLTTGLGMLVMTGSGLLLFFGAPFMIGLLTPDTAIRALGTQILRIEAFAEPMYAASIVASGVFRGAGDTLVPSFMSFFCMWVVRIPLSAFLAVSYGLRGVWVAMCVELCVRGAVFLIRLKGTKWQQKIM